MAEFTQKTEIQNQGLTGGFRGISKGTKTSLAMLGYKSSGQQNIWGKISQWIPGFGFAYQKQAEHITRGSDAHEEIKSHGKQVLKKQALAIPALFSGPVAPASIGVAGGTTAGTTAATTAGTTASATGATGATATTATGQTANVAGQTAAATTTATATPKLTKMEHLKNAGELYDEYGNLIPEKKGFTAWLQRGIDPAGINTRSEGMYASGQHSGQY